MNQQASEISFHNGFFNIFRFAIFLDLLNIFLKFTFFTVSYLFIWKVCFFQLCETNSLTSFAKWSRIIFEICCVHRRCDGYEYGLQVCFLIFLTACNIFYFFRSAIYCKTCNPYGTILSFSGCNFSLFMLFAMRFGI